MQVSSISSSSVDTASMQKMMEEMKKKFFTKTDANGDGSVDASELSDLAKTTGKSASDLISTYDADKSGSLSATEFDKMMQETKPKYHMDGTDGMPPPPPPGATDSSSSDSTTTATSSTTNQLKSLIDLLKKGKTSEAETAWQNIVSSFAQSTGYDTTSATSSLMNIQA